VVCATSLISLPREDHRTLARSGCG
jgi:hypothetical protein